MSQRSSFFEKLAKFVQPLIFTVRYPSLKVELDDNFTLTLEQLKTTPVVICPNHSRHEDGELMFLISIMTKQSFKFLAAREMFRGYLGLNGVVLRSLGCVEVNRAADNSEAIRHIQHSLVADEAKVVIFPEGEISYDNDRLEKFEPGAAAIGLDTALLLRHKKQERDACLLPVAISYQFDNAEKVCLQILERLERTLSLPNAKQSIFTRATAVCDAYLASLESAEADLQTSSSHSVKGTIDERVQKILEASLLRLSTLLECKLPHASILHQIHYLQGKIFSTRKGAAHRSKSDLNKRYQETLNLVRLRSFSADKFAEQNSLNTLADVLCNLDILITGKRRIKATQTVLVSACEPIWLNQYLDHFWSEREHTIDRVTDALSKSMQTRLQSLRSNSSSHGVSSASSFNGL